MSATIWGLKTCETCRRVRKELDGQEIGYAFLDVREAGVTPAQVAGWAGAVGWERLLNKASTTWRALSEADRAGLDEAGAVRLMARHPLLIKRPLIEAATDRGEPQVFVGWSPEAKAALGAA